MTTDARLEVAREMLVADLVFASDDPSTFDALREMANALANPFDWRARWHCNLGGGEFDHDWEAVHDWAGDPNVINGTCDWSFKRCRVCGEEAELAFGERYDNEDEDWQ